MITPIKLALQDCGELPGLSAVLLTGEPGTGKTRLCQETACHWQAHLLFYQCHEGTGKEELLYDLDIRGIIEKLSPHPHKSTTQTSNNYIKEGLLYQAVRQSHNKKVVFVLDEIDKSRPAVDGFLLDFLQSGRLSDPYLGVAIAKRENLLVMATSNRERLLSEPLYRRFRRIHLSLPTPEKELEILSEMVGEEIISAVGRERVKFILFLADWQRKDERILKKVTTPEIARLLRDLARVRGRQVRRELLFTWFSPHPEDWIRIEEKFSLAYLEGMLGEGGEK